MNALSRETTMRTYLNEIKNKYDYILIDCMPSLGMVSLNALSAADSVVVPVQAQYLPAKGMTQLLQTISRVKKYINPHLTVDGMLLTLVDNRTNLAKSTVEALKKNFGGTIKLYRTFIPIAVKAAELKRKLLAGLLTLCMAVGMAVPAFAENGPSSGDYSFAYLKLGNSEDGYQTLFPKLFSTQCS